MHLIQFILRVVSAGVESMGLELPVSVLVVLMIWMLENHENRQDGAK